MAKKAAAYLSNELHTTISIEGLYFKPFKSLVLEKLYVQDQQKDTLLYAPKLTVDVNVFSIKQRILAFNTVQLDNATFFLKKYKDGKANLDFIIDYFDSGPPPVKKKKKPYAISFGKIILNNTNLRYKNLKFDTETKGLVNFEDVDLRDVNGIFENLNTNKHIVQTNIKNLRLKDKSGFVLKNLSAFTTVDSNQLELKKLHLVTNESDLGDYFRMKFNRWKDFNHFVDSVHMKASFKQSRLTSHDISFFAPELKKMKLDLKINGDITGYVNNLRAKKLELMAGNATYIKGDFSMKGLPHFKETFMDMKVEQASTNKQDLDMILGNTTGSKTKVIPSIVTKFGNVNFSGQFTGFQNDFVAFGEFKTKLGRIMSDVNMKISKSGNPSYSGNVKAYDFNLGDLLDEKDLGRTSLAATITGQGVDLAKITEKINGKIDYLEYNNYKYRNINIDGTFNKKLFDGKLAINDKNLNLVFDGDVNLNPKLPVFNFNSSIRNANLQALHFIKDSLVISADFKTNFAGNNLNNIEGDLLLKTIKIENPSGVYNVDSVGLKAVGMGKDRVLAIKSDIADASLKGEYDLNTLPSYFKTVVKKYIPSLQTKIVKHGAQNFNLDLKIKNFEPIAKIFVPKLEIIGQAQFYGTFDSSKDIATINGFVKQAKYAGIVVNNLIVDENTSNQTLQTIVTSDRIDINDSLYVKNFNVSNVLRNDSLSFNIKASDAAEDNKLDLNGLVEFGRDTVAKLNILPSELVLNKETWKLEDKVRIKLNDDKTTILGFDLSNGGQLVTINGIISSDKEDKLDIGFENFQLSTLNPLVKSRGIHLGGKLNGDISLAGVLKKPEIKANLKTDSLSYNKNVFGDLVLTADYDVASQIANVDAILSNQSTERAKITGRIDVASETNNLDLNVNLNESELAIFEPFVRKLVSNLKGKVSSDLNINGTFEHPKINGALELKEAKMTVNYLKTRYTLNHKFAVENSVIALNDGPEGLIITDEEGEQATATGKVDLNNIDNPFLDNIIVNAKNKRFIALNTTAKDNSLYYGKAYANGIFSFDGPTNKLKINITAKTEAGTVFNLPLNNSSTVGERDFITFVGPDTTKTVVKKPTSFDGLTMSFDLTVDPNSVANIYTELGKLSGKGNAALSLKINSLGDFEMSGDYIIESGKFDFTAQEIINKQFEIKQGGTIRWTGNPSAAQINLKTTYAVRAGLGDLYSAANIELGAGSNNRVLAEAQMNLSGLLLHPEIVFDINFPSDPGVKDQLQSYLSDQNNVTIQAISLIARRSFAKGSGGKIGEQLTSGVTSAATELVFNQLNNVLSSLDLNFVDLNIKSLNEASASFKFFNDRLILNTGIVDKRNVSDVTIIDLSKNTVGREVEALYLIKKDGSLVLKAANKMAPRDVISIVNQGDYINSVGLIYSQDFDSFKEFLQRLVGRFRKKDKQPKPTTPTAPNAPAVIPKNKEAVKKEEPSEE